MPYHTRRVSDPVRPRARDRDRPAPLRMSTCRPWDPASLRLHPDDDSSKVFHAIARSLAAVNNCAMTVKDLAESSLRHGLVCSGSAPLNAASQQITSFIRAHQRRCEEQSVKPLINSFVLTGTEEDDKYISALYSRSGGTGARRTISSDTSFRKGTCVWYLSSDAGYENPFERVGVSPSTCKKRRRPPPKPSASSDDSEEEQRPKIKLKIRLPRPNFATTTLPQIPPATPSTARLPVEEDAISLDSPPMSPSTSHASPALSLPPYPIVSHCHYLFDIPLSPYEIPEYASPPPESEDDTHDFHASMMADDVDYSDDEDFDDDDRMSVSLKYEADSERDDDGRRSRSASWATTTDPKTPREGERVLSYPPVKIESKDDLWANQNPVKSLLDQWDAPRMSSASDLVKPELTSTSPVDDWSKQEDLTLDSPFQDHEPEIKLEDSPNNFSPPSSSKSRVGRSFSTPLMGEHHPSPFSSMPSSPITALSMDDVTDDVVILSPDNVGVDELECESLWKDGLCPPLVKRSSSRRGTKRVDVGNASHQNLLPVRTHIVEGVRMYELTVQGHTLRRRADNTLIHLPSLVDFASTPSPAAESAQASSSRERGSLLSDPWVSIVEARTLLKAKPLTREVVAFLQDGSLSKRGCGPATRHHLPVSPNRPQSANLDAEKSVPILLPPISLRQNVSELLYRQNEATSKRSFYDFSDKPSWLRDGFTDWKVNADTELVMASSTFQLLTATKPGSSTGPEAQSDERAEDPLSPQEEEIFRTLVFIQEARPPVAAEAPRTAAAEEEEDAADGGDEAEEAKASCPRRSKRVASKATTARITEQTTARRSARGRK